MEELHVQLSQMRGALEVAAEEDRPALQSIIKDLESLIGSVTGEDTTGVAVEATQPQVTAVEEEIDEFARFQAEIAALENAQTAEPSDSVRDDTSSVVANDQDIGETEGSNISSELAALEGMKCLAPHEESWGQIGFYPAMISQILGPSGISSEAEEFNSMDSILVKVVFLQPVVRSQRLCPFYQEDKCRFDDADCRFSHGEVVPLIKLREYSDPDYSQVIPGAKVLAKYADELWYNATVTKLTSDGNCEVEFDKDNETCEIAIHETNPVLSPESSGYSSDSCESENEAGPSVEATVSSDDILKVNATEALGDWEKYTKGMGSKLMLRMGYVMGSGLGRKLEGRIIPVDAVMVPPGMSLDKFMNLKEKAGGNSNLFSVEKKLKRAERKHAAMEQVLAKKKQNSETVFEFINNKLSGHQKKQNDSSFQLQKNKVPQSNLNKESLVNLKKNMLHVGESMKKVNKDIRKVQEAVKRVEGRDAITLARMKEKLVELQNERDKLIKLESSIVKEQRSRSDKKKLVEF